MTENKACEREQSHVALTVQAGAGVKLQESAPVIVAATSAPLVLLAKSIIIARTSLLLPLWK
jgi:hypothetical protein